MDGIEHLEQIQDPAERAREIGRRLEEIPSFQTRLAVMRRAAINEMRAKGMSFAAIGAEIGLTRARVERISSGKG